MSQTEYRTSKAVTRSLTTRISGRGGDETEGSLLTSAEDRKARTEIRIGRDKEGRAAMEKLVASSKGRAETALREVRELRSPVWLSGEPAHRGGCTMSKEEWRTSVVLLFGMEHAIEVPEDCPSCGKPNDVPHSLSCPSGHQVFGRHEEVKEELAAILDEAKISVLELRNPRIPGDKRHFGDILVRGLFTRGRSAHIDVRVIDTASICRVGKDPLAALRGEEWDNTLD